MTKSKDKAQPKPAPTAWRKWTWVPAVLMLVAVLIVFAIQPIRQSQLLKITAIAGNVNIEDVQVFVPAGEFLMGSADAANEKPEHTVYLDAFWIDKHEVSNAMYQKCAASGNCDPPSKTKSYKRVSYYGEAKFANYPVIYVSWKDAMNYCAWAGKRLPSEAEWEKSARGSDGRLYPWGNNPPSGKLANFMDPGNSFTDTAPVDSLADGASPYGAVNMAGNVWEWVADWYQADYYTTQQNWRNPTGPSNGSLRVIRGGSLYNVKWNLRTSGRLEYDPKLKSDAVGFRCARSDAPR